jgi:hypothetical protein
MYRYCTIFLFTVVGLISCGSPLKTKLESMQPELDTAFYNKYIEKGPDTNMYPVFISTSSQRDPSEKFGTPNLMDGNMDTYWSSSFGLNTGEHLSIELGNIPAHTCKIHISKDMVMARIFTVSVFVNDSLLGNFPSGAPITLPKGNKKLKIIAGETDGLNEVKLPIINDSTNQMQVTRKDIITRYNSKSFGISEIEFFNDQGKKMPVKALPIRRATVMGAFNANPDERFYLFDGNTGTSALWSQAAGTGKLVFTFPDFTPFTKLRIYIGHTDYLNYPFVAEVGLQIGGKKEQKFTLKPGLNEMNMTEPFVARTYTLTFYKFANGAPAGAINEIQGFDGARWFSIEPDSMYTRADRLRDSLAHTPVKNILNTQTTYAYDYTLLNNDTVIIRNANNIPQQYVDKKVAQKSTILIRSNYTWEATTVTTTLTVGKKTSLVETRKNMFGDYKIASKNAEQVVFNVRYQIHQTTSVDGKPGKAQSNIQSGKMVITTTHVSLEGVLEMLVSY